MKKLYFILAILATLGLGFFAIPAGAQEVSSSAGVSHKINVIEFYRESCSHCQAIKPFLKDIEKKYKDEIIMKRYEVELDEVARALYLNFLDAYAVPRGEGVVPMIFVGDKVLNGDVSIQTGLEPALAYCLAKGCALNDGLDAAVGGLVPKPLATTSDRGNITLGLIVVTALIDSVNPCAIAVLLFLIAFLLAIKASKQRLLLLGGVYIFAVFATYLLAGFGLLKFIRVFNLAGTIKFIAGGILIFAGLVSIKDFFWYGRGISLKIPERAKPIIQKYLQTGSIPAIFLAGVLVSAFELPCTGEVYLGILSMMSGLGGAAPTSGILYLLLYNVIFVLPLILILLAAVFGLKIDRIEQVRQERRKWLRLLIGLGMLFLAYWILK